MGNTLKKTVGQIDLSTLVQSLPGSVYWKDKNGFYLGCNEYAAQIVGLSSPSDIIGKTNHDFAKKLKWEKEVVDAFTEVDREIIETGQPKLNVEEPPFSIADGTVIRQLSNKVPLKNESGEVIGVLAISFDISHLKDLEYQLTAAKERAEQQAENAFLNLEQIVASMPGSVYWKDRNGIYKGCNDLAAKLAGLDSREDIIGKSDYDFEKELDWKPGTADALRAVDMQVMETGIPMLSHEEVTFRAADGKLTNQLTSKVPLRDKNNNIVGVVGISTDITELKETQKALAEQIKKTEKANQSKTVFLQTASHEVRGPVSNILQLIKFIYSYLKELRSTVYGQIVELSGNRQENKHELIKSADIWLDKIVSETNLIESEAKKTLDSLIHLGDLHRIELEGIKTNLEETDIISLIECSIDTFKSENPYLSKKNVIETITKSSKVPKSLFLDKANLATTLRFVIGNAVKYSHENGRVIITVTSEIENERSLLIIKIEDFGIGISEDHLSAIFINSISSDEDIEKYRYKKPSLKLNQAKLRLEASGGEIDIKSTYEKGTVVILKIPFFTAIYQTNHEFLKVDKTGNDKVLLMEDDFLTQLTERKLLEECGCSVDVVPLGLEAIKAVKSNNYRAVFLDITVPDVDGLEVMKIIKSFKPNLSVIAITSHVSKFNQDCFQDEGFDAVLTKPVNKEKLREIVEIIFDNDENN